MSRRNDLPKDDVGPVERSVVEAQTLCRTLMRGATLSGFVFDTSFTLRFDRCTSNDEPSIGLPAEIELEFVANWWFGDRDAWDARVTSLAARGAVEPAAPIQAYDLAKLRWSEGATVAEVDLSSDLLQVVFVNGERLVASCQEDGDEIAWALFERGVPEWEWRWSLTCQSRIFFAKQPR